MTRLALPFLIAALAVGCPEADPDPVADEPTPDPCANAPGLLAVSPEPDDQDLYTRVVEVTWDAIPNAPILTVEDSQGIAVDGAIEDDDNGRTLRFTASEVLPPSDTFTVTVDWECGEPGSWAFSTGPYGDVLDDPNDLIDRVFNLDLGSATIVEPAGVGALLEGLITDVFVLFQLMDISDFDASELHVMGALGALDGGDVVQDMCTESIPLTFGQDGELGTEDDLLAGWNDPWLQVGPTELTIDVDGTPATIRDLELAFLFHPQATDFVGGRLAGSIDTRPLVPLLDENGDPDAICALAEKTVGISCEDCGNGEIFCLTLRAEDIEGSMLWDGGLTPVTDADIDLNPACD